MSAEQERKVSEEGTAAVQDMVGEFLDTANVSRVYGEPIRKDQATVIPAAEVLVALGFGIGSGSGPAEKGGPMAGGSGGGGGGRTLSRPVAVIIAEPGGVRVEPVVDATKVAIAFVTALGFMLTTLLGMMSSKKMKKQMKGEG